jgi:imidazolonepropionase-like amidohydrolase
MHRTRPPAIRLSAMVAASFIVPFIASCSGGEQDVSTGGRMLALRGATVFDGTGRPPITDAVVLVQGGKVTTVGPASAVEVPRGAEVVELAGRWLVPGLINAHGHVGPDGDRSSVPEQLEIYAHYGVTTVLSLGDEAEHMREERWSPSLRRARLLVSGPRVAASSTEEARAEVARRVDMGADWVKAGLTNPAQESVVRDVIAAARERGLPVAVHIERLEPARQIVEAGARLVAHSVRDVPVDRALIELMLERDACITPTLTRELSTFAYAERPAFFDDPFFLERSAPSNLDAYLTPQLRAQSESQQALYWREQLPLAMENLRRMHEAGVRVALGTDSGPAARFQGYFEHLELEMMVDAGLPRDAVLLAATGEAARCIGLAGIVGTIEPGAWADLLALEASPLEDIANTRRIHGVWIAGNRVR